MHGRDHGDDGRGHGDRDRGGHDHGDACQSEVKRTGLKLAIPCVGDGRSTKHRQDSDSKSTAHDLREDEDRNNGGTDNPRQLTSALDTDKEVKIAEVIRIIMTIDRRTFNMSTVRIPPIRLHVRLSTSAYLENQLLVCALGAVSRRRGPGSGGAGRACIRSPS